MKGACKLGKRQGWFILLLCIKAAEEMFCHMQGQKGLPCPPETKRSSK